MLGGIMCDILEINWWGVMTMCDILWKHLMNHLNSSNLIRDLESIWKDYHTFLLHLYYSFFLQIYACFPLKTITVLAVGCDFFLTRRWLQTFKDHNGEEEGQNLASQLGIKPDPLSYHCFEKKNLEKQKLLLNILIWSSFDTILFY